MANNKQLTADNTDTISDNAQNQRESKPTVLIVDDDIQVCRALFRTLKREPFEVVIAHNGFQAGVLLNKHQPHVMTLDLTMPGLNGLDVLKFTRENPSYSRTKILVISGNANINMTELLTEGADAILQKPFKNEVLISTIKSLLE